MKKKIDFSRVETWLFMALIFYTLFFVCLMKVLGASELPKEVEKEGYCKLKYGENYYYKDGVCKGEIESKEFSEEDFEVLCPDQKIFSSGFNSECFNLGKW